MRYEQLGNHYVLRLDDGEEVVSTLRCFALERSVLAGRFLAWGAFQRLRLQYGRLAGEKYEPQLFELERQVEVAGLLGNIGVLDDKPVVHAHLSVADSDFHTYSGHLVEGIVGPTLEAAVTLLPRALHRFWNAGLNVAVLDPEEAAEEGERLAAWP